jgi:hypothetical protein
MMNRVGKFRLGRGLPQKSISHSHPAQPGVRRLALKVTVSTVSKQNSCFNEEIIETIFNFVALIHPTEAG